MGRRGWILTALGVVAAIVAGILVATMVLPSGQPNPMATATATTVRIDPAPVATATVVPVVRSVATPADRAQPARKRPPSNPRAMPDSDPVSITTINSW